MDSSWRISIFIYTMNFIIYSFITITFKYGYQIRLLREKLIIIIRKFQVKYRKIKIDT